MGIFGSIIAKTIGKVADGAGSISKDITKVKLAKSGDKVQIENNAHDEFNQMLKFRGLNSFQANNRNWYDSFVDGLNRLIFPLTALPFIYLLWRLVLTDPQKLLTALGVAGFLAVVSTLLGVRQIGKIINVSGAPKTFILPEKKKEVKVEKTQSKNMTTNSTIPKVQKFVMQYRFYAQSIEKRFGINKIGALSHAALETGWGEKILVGFDEHGKSIHTNNMFNIKASKSWKGLRAVKKVWEVKEGKDIFENSSFRVYEDIDDSFIDYAKLLNKSRYKKVIEALSVEEYANALYECGYFTDPKAPEKIIRISRMLNIPDFKE
jgi:hypothetical protein